MSGLTYREAGVDIDAGDELVRRIKPLAERTRIAEQLGGIGGFAGLCGLPAGMKEPILVSGTDGVGTKLKLAFLANVHDTVGIDLVAMCVNDVATSGARPLFFLDYFATGKLDVDTAEKVVAGIAEGCHQAGCALLGGETAELPGFYTAGEYDLAGFTVGVVEKSAIIDGSKVRERATWCSASRRRDCTRTATRWRARRCSSTPTCALEQTHPELGETARRGPAAADAHLREGHPGGACRGRSPLALPRHRRRPAREPAARAAQRHRARARHQELAAPRHLRPHPAERGRRRRGDVPHLQHGHRPGGRACPAEAPTPWPLPSRLPARPCSASDARVAHGDGPRVVLTLMAPTPLNARGAGLGARLEPARRCSPPSTRAAAPLGSTRVISDRDGAPGARARARARHPQRAWSPPRTSPIAPAWDRALASELAALAPELVVLAGFMRWSVRPCWRASPGASSTCTLPCLPAFPGIDAPAQALRHGVTLSGCTVHLVDAGVDTGPILAQAAVPVLPSDDAASLHARIQTAEHRLLPAVVARHRHRRAARSN